MIDILSVVGKIVFAGYFLYSGIHILLNFQLKVEDAVKKKMPIARVSVGGGGLLLCLGAVAILSGFLMEPILIIIAAFLIVSAFGMHSYWKVVDAKLREGDWNNFYKNIAIAAACLMLL